MAEAAQFDKPAFELTGGALCLDFVNTSEDHKAPESGGEKILNYADMLAFGVQTGDLPVTDARKLLSAANHSPAKAEALLKKARDLREVLYRIFSTAAEDRKPSRDDIERLNLFVGDALRHTRIVPRDEGYERAWADIGALERPLWSVALSAMELLTSPEYPLVRECGSERCSWLFVDRSRNHIRRWCNMKVCGNRAKARRHYERVKA